MNYPLAPCRFQIKIFRGAATEISPSSLLRINEPHKGLITRLNINIIDAEDEALSTLRQLVKVHRSTIPYFVNTSRLAFLDWPGNQILGGGE